jgi:hypothetical protein
MTTRRFRVLLPALGVLLLPLVGCGQKKVSVYPARGTVLYHGKPVHNATLYFIPAQNSSHPADLRPQAVTGEDGRFAVSTFSGIGNAEADGALAGEYLVSVVWKPVRSDGPNRHLDLLNGRYSDPKRSGLSVKIEADKNNELPPFHLK